MQVKSKLPAMAYRLLHPTCLHELNSPPLPLPPVPTVYPLTQSLSGNELSLPVLTAGSFSSFRS